VAPARYFLPRRAASRSERLRNDFRCGSIPLVPVAAALKVEALARDFRSQRRVADALGVSPAQVSRWKRGQGIDPDNAERLDLLELAMSFLLRVYEPETAEKWLFGLNPRLRNRRPIDVIRAGETQELLSALRQERAGSYA
jgi:uncharacterized protein (DUF2384 family)